MVDFDTFCQEKYLRLVGSLGLYCGDKHIAEELAQEALARAWRHWRKVRGMQDPSAWLYTVAFNLARSHFRRLAAERRARQRLVTQRPPQSDWDPDLATVHALREAVAALPRRQKTVLLLHYYLGMSFPEIAMHIDAPVPTVKTWAARGIAALRNNGIAPSEEALNVR